MKLDEKDRLLLKLLMQNARMSNKDLAEGVGLSPSACLARVRRLESHGVIVGYRAIVARSSAGRRVESWADVRLVDPTSETIEQFMCLVSRTPEIVEAHRTAGPYDFAIRFCAGDGDAWVKFRQSLSGLGCEAQSRLSVLIEPLK